MPLRLHTNGRRRTVRFHVPSFTLLATSTDWEQALVGLSYSFTLRERLGTAPEVPCAS